VSIVSTIGPTADLVRRIRGEYLEMPGLRVTARQAQRLFGLNATICDEVLAGLLQSGFLSRTLDGMFSLTQAGDQIAPARPSGQCSPKVAMCRGILLAVFLFRSAVRLLQSSPVRAALLL